MFLRMCSVQCSVQRGISMFVRAKPHKLKSGEITYYYLVENKRKDKTVVSKVKKYLGKEVPKEYKKNIKQRT